MNEAIPMEGELGSRGEDGTLQRSDLEFLIKVQDRLAASLDYQATLAVACALVTPELVDCCILDILEEDGGFTRFSSGGTAQGEPLCESIPLTDEGRRFLDDLASDRPTLFQGLTEPLPLLIEHHAGEEATVVVVPLDARGRRLGLLRLIHFPPRSPFSPRELRLIHDLARHIALALDNAQAYRRAEEKAMRLEKETEEMREHLEAVRGTMRKVEVRVRRLFEANVIGILFSNLDGAVNEANDAFLQMIGYSREELKEGKVRWTDLTPPEYQERSAMAVEELKRIAVCTPFQKEYIRKDGTRIPVMIGAALIEGAADYAVTFVIDLTEQKKAENALRESEERNRALLNALPDLIFRLSADGRLIDVMTNDESRLAVPAAQFLGRSIVDVLPQDVGGLIMENLLRVMQTGELQVFEYRLSIGGHERYYEARLVASAGEEVLGIVRDVTDRKEKEKELSTNERRFRALIENGWDGIWLFDSNATIQYASPSAARILGFSVEEMVGRTLFDLVPLEDRERITEAFGELLSEGARTTIEYRSIHKDGGWRWMEGSGTNLLNEPGVRAIVGNFRDVTERKQAEQELQARARQQAIVSNFGQRALAGVDVAILMEEAVGLVAEVLDVELCKVLELLPEGEKLLIRAGVGWEEGVVGEIVITAEPESQAGYTLHSSEPVIVENLRTETRFKGTQILHLHEVVSGISVIIQGTDRPFGILGAHSREVRKFTEDDVHFLQSMANILGEAAAREQAERAMNASEKHYRALIENSYDATALLDTSGMVIYASPSTMRVLGYNMEEFRGMNIFSLMHPDDLEHVKRLFSNLLENPGTPITAQYRNLHKNGSWRWIEGTGTNFLTESGVHTIIANYHDITERKEAETELKEAKEVAEAANRAKDQFLAVLSHELRTPLTPVLASVEALAHDEGISESARTYIEIIERNVELEARLIDDLLDLTRIAKGKLQLNRDVVDVHRLAYNVRDICLADIRQKGLRITMDLSAGEHHIYGDPARMQQVLWNLLQNAVKFTPEGGLVGLRTSNPAPRRLRVEVNDTGIGIEEDVLPRIFNAFEQGEQTITRKFGGLGLGLAISKMLVAAHGGTVAAHSGGRNHGSTFVVELDSVEPENIERYDRSDMDSESNKPALHILLVDDHADTNMVMKLLLERQGYHVSTADSVRSALDVAAREQIDLLVSDIGLPDGSGLDIMRELRNDKSLRGIALSGFGMEEDVRRSKEAGFDEHLTKPVTFQTLIQAIRGVLE